MICVGMFLTDDETCQLAPGKRARTETEGIS